MAKNAGRAPTLKTLIRHLDEKATKLLGHGVIDQTSPIRDVPVGKLIDMMVMADYGMPQEIPGQTRLDA